MLNNNELKIEQSASLSPWQIQAIVCQWTIEITYNNNNFINLNITLLFLHPKRTCFAS